MLSLKFTKIRRTQKLVFYSSWLLLIDILCHCKDKQPKWNRCSLQGSTQDGWALLITSSCSKKLSWSSNFYIAHVF